MRTFASLGAYLATATDEGMQVHQFVDGTVRGAGFALAVETDYPRDGLISIRVESAPEGEAELAFRIPAWAVDATLDGEHVEPGLARLRRTWSAGDRLELVLPLVPRVVHADDRIDAIRGSVAIQVGPLVYAVEQTDLPEGVAADDLHIDLDAPIRLGEVEPALSVRFLETTGHVHRRDPRASTYSAVTTVAVREALAIRAVPYFAWANRGSGAMRVWMATD